MGKRAVMLLVAVVMGLWVVPATYALPAPADSLMVLGKFTGAVASNPGEVSFTLLGINTGMPPESLKLSDSVKVDTGFAFSSLDSCMVPPNKPGVKALDSIYIRYFVQNYANYNADSLQIYAYVPDTTQIGHFAPTYFRIMNKDSITARGAVYTTDTARCNVGLGAAAMDTFVIKIKIPTAASAADMDSIKVVLRIRDHRGAGANDSWPSLMPGRQELDTTNIFMHLHTSIGMADTLWDYGDTQYDTVTVKISSPMVKTRTITALLDGSRKPGNRIQYTLYYDNDGSSKTVDSGFYVAYIPKNTALDTVSLVQAGNGGPIMTYVNYFGSWINHVPANTTIAGRDSLLRVAALKFVVAPGCSSQVAGTNADSPTNPMADDSTGTDAGRIRFVVKIR
jgi:hypothetical protein